MIGAAWTVARRELAGFFYSPIAYGIATIVLLLNGLFFNLYLVDWSDGDLRQAVPPVFGLSLFYWFLALLVPPLLTMRLFAEEKRSGTIEMLMTAPVTDVAVVLGKFAAVFAYYVLLWLPTVLYFVLVRMLGGDPDFGLVETGLLGTVLCGGLFLAIGLFASASTSNQVLAAASALVVNILLFFIPFYASRTVSTTWKDLLARVSILHCFGLEGGGFWNGLVDTAHVVFFLSATAYFLFLTVRIVEARKWK